MKELQNNEKNRTQSADSQHGGLLEQISDYAQAHLAEKVTLKELSERFDVSVSTITQTFQRKAGVSFHRYLTEHRIEKAAELIRSGISLEKAGQMVGYMDHSSFYRAFRQIRGLSPREYRKSILQK